MKELKQHPFCDHRTVKAYETKSGGYVQVQDHRDLYYGNYTVEVYDGKGGMMPMYSRCNLEKCIAWAQCYADTH